MPPERGPSTVSGHRPRTVTSTESTRSRARRGDARSGARWNSRWAAARPNSSEGGFVAGAESLIFGVLIFVFGTIMVLNAWSALDARFAAAAAAREAVRAVVDAPNDADLVQVANSAAATAFAGHGRDPADLEVVWVGDADGPERARCGEVRFRVETTVDVVLLPRWSSPPSFQVSALHAELIESYRAGIDATVCEV